MPDVGALNLPGASAESAARHRGAGDSAEGLRGLKALGVRDLNYRMSFLACGVSSAGRDSILFGLGEGPILSIYDPRVLYCGSGSKLKSRSVWIGIQGVVVVVVLLKLNTTGKFSYVKTCPGKNKLGSDDDQVESAEDLKRGMTNEEWETVYNMTKVITNNKCLVLNQFCGCGALFRNYNKWGVRGGGENSTRAPPSSVADPE